MAIRQFVIYYPNEQEYYFPVVDVRDGETPTDALIREGDMTGEWELIGELIDA